MLERDIGLAGKDPEQTTHERSSTSYYLATGQEGGKGGRPPYKAKDGHVVISASGREMGSRLLQIATGDPNAVAKTGAFTGRMSLGDTPRKAVEA
jgi:hypothetical protein